MEIGKRNGLVTWGCREREEPGDKVEGIKIASARIGGGGQWEGTVVWTGYPIPE